VGQTEVNAEEWAGQVSREGNRFRIRIRAE